MPVMRTGKDGDQFPRPFFIEKSHRELAKRRQRLWDDFANSRNDARDSRTISRTRETAPETLG